jgi:hypothetical protein
LGDAQAVALEIEVLAISMWRAASLQDMPSASLLKTCDAGLVAAIRELDACCIIPRTEPDLSGEEIFLASN